MMGVIQNAFIEATSIRFDRGTFLNIWITLNYGDQGTQGCCYKVDMIGRIMKVLEVKEWGHLVGQAVRVKREDEFQGAIIDLGHFTKDRWVKGDNDDRREY
jgi:hypothetical protein